MFRFVFWFAGIDSMVGLVVGLCLKGGFRWGSGVLGWELYHGLRQDKGLGFDLQGISTSSQWWARGPSSMLVSVGRVRVKGAKQGLLMRK